MHFDFIERVAVALYEEQSKTLKTFLASCDRQNPLIHYETTLFNAPSLEEICKEHRPRVVNDLNVFSKGEHIHTVKINEEGYQASYTVPIYNDSKCMGFL